MENSQTKNIQEEVSGIMNQYILSQFRSEKEMKTYYLQMSTMIRSTDSHPSIDKEYTILKKLCSKLKQYYSFIQTLGDHEWGKEINHL